MNNNSKNQNIEEIRIDNLFDQYQYIVPIYQRNYSWGKKEIAQLLDDIKSSDNIYYLGTLVVYKREDNLYEVIDGQQRLTTLYMLKLWLGKGINKHLKFEARKNYETELSKIYNKMGNEKLDIEVEEIAKGYKVIDEYLQSSKEKIDEKLKKVVLVQITVPDHINLNQYFETMNTRGEQLEPHQILKAKLLGCLENEADRKAASIIWDACAHMGHYIQMNFEKGIREKLFTENWTDLNKDLTWDKILEIFNPNTSADLSEQDKSSKQDISSEEYTLFRMLETFKKDNVAEYKNNKTDDDNDDNNNEYFESIISFPDLLMQVHSIVKTDIFNGNIIDIFDSSSILLDDKKLIDVFSDICENSDKGKAKEVERFLITLLEIRTLFDTYVLKRNKEGKWAINKLEKATYDNKIYNRFVLIFNEEEYKKLLYLQVALRITYTAPQNMRWLTILLKYLQTNTDSESIINILENYCRKKVRESDFKNKTSGFDIERIVFTYLDYLLYFNGNINHQDFHWDLKFRNSVEHLYPRNSISDTVKNIENFGNLAYIAMDDNIKNSNHSPKEKCDFMVKTGAVFQSPKLYIMAKIIETQDWNDEAIFKHCEEMFDILNTDLEIYN